MKLFRFSNCIAVCLLITTTCMTTNAQNIKTTRFTGTAEITSVKDGEIQAKTSAGKTVTLRLNKKGEDNVIINDQFRLKTETNILVEGTVDQESIQKGALLKITAKVDRIGKIEEPVKEFQVMDSASGNPEAKELESGAVRKMEVIGTLTVMRNGRFILQVPKQAPLRIGKVSGAVAEDAVFSVSSTNYQIARPGDKIKVEEGIQFDGKDIIVRSGTIALAKNATTNAPISSQPNIDPRYAKLSDAPGKPRTKRTKNFILHTDVSDRNEAMLIDKLEIMRGLIVAYYGRATTGLVEIYVVRDLSQWPKGQFPPTAVYKISEPAGVTISVSLGEQRKATAYSCDDHGVAQHEAVHALCFQTFGDTGPSWYSEGMAELGQYWKKGQLEVEISSPVLNYLKSQTPRNMLTIVNPKDPPGTWQDYAWRWALCHLLAHNPNYNAHFKGLGMGLMEKRNGITFEAVYGPVAQQILFEYDFFLRNLDNGLRADLIAWDWQTKNFPLAEGGKKTVKVDAARGWQPSKIQLTKGNKYEIQTSGSWKLSPQGKDLDAAGDKDGNGKLVGILFKDNKILQEIEINKYGTITAPVDGDLYLRCKDQWNQIQDNEGSIEVSFHALEKK